MKSAAELRTNIRALDRMGYQNYKALEGEYQFGFFVLGIDHIQSDPFAPPSKVHCTLEGTVARFPEPFYSTKAKKIALEDYLTRKFAEKLAQYRRKTYATGLSGILEISKCGQEVLERSCMEINAQTGSLTTHFEIGFPAKGRTIDGKELIHLLFEFIPSCVSASLKFFSLNEKDLRKTIRLSEDQAYIRAQLQRHSLVAFVANGSILPRGSGVAQTPMLDAIPFVSPPEYEVTLHLPRYGTLIGMGIPCGVTLIVGGGFHGKSTLLEALEQGVYNHIQGDGREYVITDCTALKLRAEDSRYISSTDISSFINHLPGAANTTCFSSEDASGSTSQAANLVEGLEAGAKVLLIDEDTSATNFMIRDELMRLVVTEEEEPITPFYHRVRELYEQEAVSTILVAGSSGAFFHVADAIIQMKEYVPYDITPKAKEVMKAYPPKDTAAKPYQRPTGKRIPCQKEDTFLHDYIKVKVYSMDSIQINNIGTDLRYLEQIVHPEQLGALAYLIIYAVWYLMDGSRTLGEVVDLLEEKIDQEGLGFLHHIFHGAMGLSRPRRQEIFMCLNRCRELYFRAI
ncbi:MAG: ABC-ATPase domain-containing protein [Lachnospiraceae bacterium]|nr:ABC-ATPase domain-containing protein [Lachnospiraceae bacterium]